MQILCSLYNNGPTRYNQLKKALDGVSNTVLANAAGAGGDGRGSPAGVPWSPGPVEYAITEPCRQLIPILDALGDWSMAL